MKVAILTTLGLGLLFCAQSALALPQNSNCTSHDINGNSGSSKAPYNTSKFKHTLNNTRTLQWPRSNYTCLTTTKIKSHYYINNRWYITGSHMVFNFQDEGIRDTKDANKTTRMELRGNSFNAKSTKSPNKSLEIRFKASDLNEDKGDNDHSSRFTVAQLFSDGAGPKSSEDIVRFEVRKQSNGTADVYAQIDNDVGTGDSESYKIVNNYNLDKWLGLRMTYNRSNGMVKLYSREDGESSFKQVGESNGYDIKDHRNGGNQFYFKSGCYLQESGECNLRFTTLRFDD